MQIIGIYVRSATCAFARNEMISTRSTIFIKIQLIKCQGCWKSRTSWFLFFCLLPLVKRRQLLVAALWRKSKVPSSEMKAYDVWCVQMMTICWWLDSKREAPIAFLTHYDPEWLEIIAKRGIWIYSQVLVTWPESTTWSTLTSLFLMSAQCNLSS